jgi:putrescine transport system permease protein
MVGEFVIPDLLGGSDALMLGKVIWTEFFASRDWPAASAVAIALLATLIGPILVYERQQAKVLGAAR